MEDTNQVEVKQNSALGSHTTQIGVQNNYSGLTCAETMEIIFAMFNEYCPKLRQEVLEELRIMLEEKLKNIPTENIVVPSLRVTVPTLQNVSITEEVEIRELYASLLAKSMDKTVKNGVHPGFVEIIKQLSSDEAKILRYLSIHTTVPTIILRKENKEGEGIDIAKNFSNIGELSGCEKPLNIGMYFNNLVRLGILEDSQGMASLINTSLYEPLKKHNYIIEKQNQITNGNNAYNEVKIKESFVSLTEYGKAFCNICITPNKIEGESINP